MPMQVSAGAERKWKEDPCFVRINWWCSFLPTESPVFLRIPGASGGGRVPC